MKTHKCESCGIPANDTELIETETDGPLCEDCFGYVCEDSYLDRSTDEM